MTPPHPHAPATPLESRHTEVEAVLTALRPNLHRHGGDVQLLGVSEEGVVSLQLTGHCAGCLFASLTFEYGLKENLILSLPWVSDVALVPASTSFGEEAAAGLAEHASDIRIGEDPLPMADRPD